MSVEGGLSLGGALGKEILKENVGLLALSPSGLKEAAQDAVVFQSLVGTGALDNSAHDDDGAQTSLGLIVGRGDMGTSKTGEEEFLLVAQEALTKGLASRMAQ